jgi:hypothetical protein
LAALNLFQKGSFAVAGVSVDDVEGERVPACKTGTDFDLPFSFPLDFAVDIGFCVDDTASDEDFNEVCLRGGDIAGVESLRDSP